MNNVKNEQLDEIRANGRKNKLKSNEVMATSIELPDKKLLRKLIDENYGTQVRSMWTVANSHRAEWLNRQEAFLSRYDEFIEPIYDRPVDWAAAIHLPISLIVAKTYHARFFSAIFTHDIPFTVSARKGANAEREQLVEDLMGYSVKDWANDYQGIEDEVDKALWQWVTRGVFLTKNGWEKRYSQFKDIVKKPESKIAVVNIDGQDIPVETTEEVDREEDVTLLDFDGPTLRNINAEDLVIIGNADPDKADAVIESTYLTASDLFTLVDRGLFDADSVNTITQTAGDIKGSKISDGIKLRQAQNAGLADIDNRSAELTRYHILECYVKKDVYGSGINSELVVWVHESSGTILRATYLHRINSKTKKRPYAKVDFYKRQGQIYGVGLIELIYSITKEIDALNNMAVDFGLVSSMPFGYVRATSSLSNVAIPIEPGALVPLDNPSQDVFFPNLGNRGGWASAQIQFLYSMIERLTGLSDISFGSTASQGAARTASGVRALLNESNINLDIFLRRLNRGLKKIYRQMFADIQAKMPAGLEFRITGDDGAAYFRQVKTRDEIAGSFDFALEPNSQASNPAVRIENATSILQLTSNMLDVQLGIVTPLQRYEALKNYLAALNIRDYGRFIQKPVNQERTYSPEEMANKILAGYPLQFNPMDDLQGFITYAQYIIDNDDILGQFSPQQAIMLASKQQEAAQMQQALEQMQAQTAVTNQMRSNSQQSMNQVPVGNAAIDAPVQPE